MSNVFLFLAFMIPGTVLLGAYDVFVKKILKRGVHDGLLLGINLTATGAILFLALNFFGFPEIKEGFWIALSASIILNIFGQRAWYLGFKNADASLISPFKLLIPPMVLITGFFVLKEIPSFFGISGVFITVVGLWFLISGEAMFREKRFSELFKNPAVFYAFSGALLWSISFPFDKKAVLASSSLLFGAYAFLGIGVATLLISFLMNSRSKDFFKEIYPSRKLIALTIIMYTLGPLLTFTAFKYALVSYASATKQLTSLWAVLLSGQILAEQNITRKLFAAGIMLTGVLIILVLG